MGALTLTGLGHAWEKDGGGSGINKWMVSADHGTGAVRRIHFQLLVMPVVRSKFTKEQLAEQRRQKTRMYGEGGRAESTPARRALRIAAVLMVMYVAGYGAVLADLAKFVQPKGLALPATPIGKLGTKELRGMLFLGLARLSPGRLQVEEVNQALGAGESKPWAYVMEKENGLMMAVSIPADFRGNSDSEYYISAVMHFTPSAKEDTESASPRLELSKVQLVDKRELTPSELTRFKNLLNQVLPHCLTYLARNGEMKPIHNVRSRPSTGYIIDDFEIRSKDGVIYFNSLPN